MTTRAAGSRKNLLLTLWLLLPFAVLGVILAVIFLSYGNKKMDARPVGQGAADTGGANALGELLAGNDPIEQERTARDLREGKLIDPLDWPHGVRVSYEIPPRAPKKPSPTFFVWTGAGGPPPRSPGTVVMISGHSIKGPDTNLVTAEIDRATLNAIFEAGRPGAGIYLTNAPEAVARGNTLYNPDGSEAVRVQLMPVPADRTTEGALISVRVDTPPD